MTDKNMNQTEEDNSITDSEEKEQQTLMNTDTELPVEADYELIKTDPNAMWFKYEEKIEKITKEEAVKMIESKAPKKKPSKKKSPKKKSVKKK